MSLYDKLTVAQTINSFIKGWTGWHSGVQEIIIIIIIIISAKMNSSQPIPRMISNYLQGRRKQIESGAKY